MEWLEPRILRHFSAALPPLEGEVHRALAYRRALPVRRRNLQWKMGQVERSSDPEACQNIHPVRFGQLRSSHSAPASRRGSTATRPAPGSAIPSLSGKPAPPDCHYIHNATKSRSPINQSAKFKEPRLLLSWIFPVFRGSLSFSLSSSSDRFRLSDVRITQYGK